MITPLDFLAQAESWIKLPNEADWRSAASRGYYAAFHGARLLLQDLGFVVPHGPQSFTVTCGCDCPIVVRQRFVLRVPTSTSYNDFAIDLTTTSTKTSSIEMPPPQLAWREESSNG